MVMTHKSIKEQKAKKIFVKEDNPARKFMSHAEAVADNARIKADREKVELYAENLKKEREANLPPVAKEDAQIDPSEKEQRIAAYKAEMETLKGPGSKAKKENIQAKINMLIHSY